MKTKSVLLIPFLASCLFFLSCNSKISSEFNESNNIVLQATPIADNNKFNLNENKFDINGGNENNSFPKNEVRNFNLPKIQITKGEFEKYRQKIFFALLKQELISPESALINFSHVCNLETGKNTFLVINIFEFIKSPYSDRGYNRIILLDNSLKEVNTITIFADSSLFCDGNKLYLHNSKMGFDANKVSDNSKPIANSDNTIFFDDTGRVNSSQTTDFHNLPALKERLKKGLTPQ